MAFVHPFYHGGKNTAEQITEEQLSCPLCKKPGFRVPKMLQCGHTFCAPCIEGFFGLPPGTPGVQKFFCFLCGNECTLPEKGVAGLPDSLIANIQIDRLLCKHNAQRGQRNAIYNVDNYVMNFDTHIPRFPLPGEPPCHDNPQLENWRG